jgi:hypothetical protein
VPPKLFSNDNVSDASEGLFVYVRDGQIEIATADEVLHLGRGEAGFAGADGVNRPNTVPKFIDFDSLPMPTSHNPLLVSLLSESGIKPNNACH